MTPMLAHADVLDLQVDALIYSTNVMLNCSGGVGAALRMRYGQQVQTELHDLLRQQGRRQAHQGELFAYAPTGTPYEMIYHTLPCDAWYQSSPAQVAELLQRALRNCVQEKNIQRVGLSALATGFGHVEFLDFFRVAAPILADPAYESLDWVCIAVPDRAFYERARELIRREHLPLLF